MHVRREELDELIQTIWGTLMEAPLTCASIQAAPAPGKMMTAIIHLMGDEIRSLWVECPEQMARCIAGAMFEIEAEALSIEEVRDALGEVANMLGGNLKGMCPQSYQLSLPTVSSRRTRPPRRSGGCPARWPPRGWPRRCCRSKSSGRR